jgi:hypothetical protein
MFTLLSNFIFHFKFGAKLQNFFYSQNFLLKFLPTLSAHCRLYSIFGTVTSTTTSSRMTHNGMAAWRSGGFFALQNEYCIWKGNYKFVHKRKNRWTFWLQKRDFNFEFRCRIDICNTL